MPTFRREHGLDTISKALIWTCRRQFRASEKSEAPVHLLARTAGAWRTIGTKPLVLRAQLAPALHLRTAGAWFEKAIYVASCCGKSPATGSGDHDHCKSARNQALLHCNKLLEYMAQTM
jgi:hypothetical protein